MLAKLNREHARVMAAASEDNLFNFVVTAYHLTDWIKRDPDVPAAAKDDLGSMYADTHVAVCRDLANAGKHFSLDPGYRGQVTEKTTSAGEGFGSTSHGGAAYGLSDVSIVVVLTDGRRLRVQELAENVIAAWNKFFERHGI